jgi:histidinol-phosphate aminotransferase
MYKHAKIFPPIKQKLDLNENIGEPGPNLISSVSSEINRDNLAYYTQQYMHTPLLDKISSFIGSGVDRYNILLTNGSLNALRLACIAFTHDESIHLVIVPTFFEYESLIQMYPHSRIDYLAIGSKDTSADIYKKLLDTLSKDGAAYTNVYIVTPSTPFGQSLSGEQVKSLVSKFPDTMFVIDEAYIEFSEVPCHSRFVSEFTNIIVTRTFSKFFGIAGMRIGYLLTHKQNMQVIGMYNNFLDVPWTSIVAATTCLENVDYYNALFNHRESKRIINQRLFAMLADTPDGLINGFSAMDGMYFLLFSNQPEKLVNTMESVNIFMRNKDNEEKGAIRCTLPPFKYLDELLTTIEDVHRSYFDINDITNCTTWLIDLDGTLRNNNHWDSLPEINKVWFNHLCNIKPSTYVLTNNITHDVHEIARMLETDIRRIINPLSALHNVVTPGSNIHVIGTQKTRDIIERLGYNTSTDLMHYDAIIITDYFAQTIDDWKVIHTHVNRDCDCLILFTEIELSVQCQNYSELKLDKDDDGVLIPSSWIIKEILGSVYGISDVTVLGKPSTYMLSCINESMDKIVMIGNTYADDAEFAHAIGALSVIIDKSKNRGYDHKSRSYIIHDIWDIDLLFVEQ